MTPREGTGSRKLLLKNNSTKLQLKSITLSKSNSEVCNHLMNTTRNKTLPTEEGYERLSEKVDPRKQKVQRNGEDMNKAAENGDPSGNAGFLAAKESYQTPRKDLNKLQDLLADTQVVTREEIEANNVRFGNLVHWIFRSALGVGVD